jgi:hypothetical protein
MPSKISKEKRIANEDYFRVLKENKQIEGNRKKGDGGLTDLSSRFENMNTESKISKYSPSKREG